MKISKIKNRKKKAITLLEIMIVIFLIGLIGSVIGYNVKGSLEEGKAFRSEQGIAKIKDILEMEMANGASVDQIIENPGFYLKNSGLVADSNKLLKDGWNQPCVFSKTKSGNTFSVTSAAWKKHKDKKQAKLPKQENSHAVEEPQDDSDED